MKCGQTSEIICVDRVDVYSLGDENGAIEPKPHSQQINLFIEYLLYLDSILKHFLVVSSTRPGQPIHHH